MNTKSSIRILKRRIDRNSPSIFAGLAIGGVFSTTLFAIRATKPAIELIEMEKKSRAEDFAERYKANPDDPSLNISNLLTPLDYVRLTWKCYIPTIASGIITIVCIISSNKINLERNAALLGLYSISENTLKEYQRKVVEKIGEKKEEKIQDELYQDKLNANPLKGETVILTGKGEYLMYETFSGRYFRSDIEFLKKKVNEFNHTLLTEMYLPINDFFDDIGLEPVDSGRKVGWDVERGLMEIKFTAKITDNGEPCIVIGYKTEPKYL